MQAPTRVLPGHPQDQLSKLDVEPRPTYTTPLVECRPLPANQLAVPAQNRLGLNQPAQRHSRDQAVEGSHDRAIGRPQRRALDLTTQHPQLVPQQE
jgi:hypothetical protein